LAFQEELYSIIGFRIKEARKKTGVSQDELSNTIGINRTSLSNIENGRHQPSLYLLYRICAELKIDVQDILPAYSELNVNEKENSDSELQNLISKKKNLNDISKMALKSLIKEL
jgi:DNA-binding XRE family transcriptional regulator